MSDSHLVFASRADADAVNARVALALGCDGVFTKWWFDVRDHPSNGSAVLIVPDGNEGSGELTAEEQAQLVAGPLPAEWASSGAG